MIPSPLVLAVPLFLLQAPADDPAKGRARAGPAGLEVVWQETLEGAIADAKTKPDGRLLIELTGNGCGACERMEALIVPSTSFFAFTRDKVPVRLKVETPEGKRLAERFGITALPGWVVATPDLLLCGFQDGPTTQTEWFSNFAESEQGWSAYLKLLDEEQKKPGDAELVFHVAEETFRRRGDSIAEPRFRRLSTDTKVRPELRERSLAYLASIELETGRPAEAGTDLEALLALATDPDLRERAELRLVDVEIARGRKDLAVGRLRAFLKSHPASPRAGEAGQLLDALHPESKETNAP